MLGSLRISEKGKRQLITLKRHTGIKNWNTLCRWAFCLSLTEQTKPPRTQIPSDSNVEMSWSVFAGTHQDILLAALKTRCAEDGLSVDRETLHDELRLHVHRGLGYLAGSAALRSIDALVHLVDDSDGAEIPA